MSDGFTLIETMTALCVAALVAMGAMQIYQSSYHLIAHIQAMRDIRHRAIRIESMLEQDVKLAGFHGCQQASAGISCDKANLSVRYMAYPSAMLVEPTKNDEVVSDNGIALQERKLTMIADCINEEVFVIKKISRHQDEQMVIPENRLRHHYDAYADVAPVVTHQYAAINGILYVRNEFGKKSKVANGVSALSFECYWNRDHTDVTGIGVDMILTQREFEQPWHFYVAR